MNKILMINPPFNIAKENYDSSLSVGILSIASFLHSKGVSLKIIDGARQANYIDLIKSEIGDCFAVGLSVMTTQIAEALQITKLIKTLNPKCLVVWGGSHPTFFTKETIIHPLIDVVCYGEGEETMLEIASGKDLSLVLGIAFKKDGQTIVNPARSLHDPKNMPNFNWHLMSEEILAKVALVPSLTSRGCPHRCTFCINAILKNLWRPRTVEQVLEDLTVIKNEPFFQGKSIRFWDENFFVDINRARKIVDGMVEKNLVMPWETTIRVDYVRNGMVDDDFMAKLKKSGCYLLSFGAESGSSVILKKIKKDITPEQIVNSAKLCLKYDIIPQYSFMIGLPGESKEDMMMTLDVIDKLIKLSPKVQVLGPQAFRPYPGSELYQECLASGWRAPESLEGWADLVQNELSYLTVENFPWVKDKAFVESMEAYVRFGAHSLKSAMGSSIKAKRFLKLIFVLICQCRWKLKFFAWPIDFKLAKKFVTK